MKIQTNKKLERGLTEYVEKKLVLEEYALYAFKATNKSETCTICMDNFEDEDPIIVYECDTSHYFHFVCGSEWLSRSYNCALCRKDFRATILACAK